MAAIAGTHLYFYKYFSEKSLIYHLLVRSIALLKRTKEAHLVQIFRRLKVKFYFFFDLFFLLFWQSKRWGGAVFIHNCTLYCALFAPLLFYTPPPWCIAFLKHCFGMQQEHRLG